MRPIRLRLVPCRLANACGSIQLRVRPGLQDQSGVLAQSKASYFGFCSSTARRGAFDPHPDIAGLFPEVGVRADLGQ